MGVRGGRHSPGRVISAVRIATVDTYRTQAHVNIPQPKIGAKNLLLYAAKGSGKGNLAVSILLSGICSILNTVLTPKKSPTHNG